jgi:putative salt-induced outer membrane protein YdiY
VRDTNRSFAHLRHRYGLDAAWDVELFGQAQQNEFALLKLRTLLGGGLRWSQQSDGLSLAIGLGSFFEREELKAAANEPAASLWRGNSYIALYYALNERVRLQNTLYYQPAWKNPADFRLLDDVALSVSLSDRLDLKLAVEIANDSRPPATIKDTDISYKTGMELRF